MHDEDLLPLEPTHLSFWAKLWELQMKMLMSRQDTELEHKFSSSPTEWPFMVRNIAYWMSSSSNVSILHSPPDYVWVNVVLVGKLSVTMIYFT